MNNETVLAEEYKKPGWCRVASHVLWTFNYFHDPLNAKIANIKLDTPSVYFEF